MSEYSYTSAAPSHMQKFLLPRVLRTLTRIPAPARLFELGCGNGALAYELAKAGYNVTAVDISESGVRHARAAYQDVRFEAASVYDDLNARFGLFDVVLSLEVVEHLYDPRAFAKTLRRLLRPEGTAIVSAPYHGYFKNLAIAVTGRWDRHHSPLWDHGHIKFWSRRTLGQLLAEAQLAEIEFHRIGRVAPLAMSMLGVYRAV